MRDLYTICIYLIWIEHLTNLLSGPVVEHMFSFLKSEGLNIVESIVFNEKRKLQGVK